MVIKFPDNTVSDKTTGKQRMAKSVQREFLQRKRTGIGGTHESALQQRKASV
jgi:hypothetical protein